MTISSMLKGSAAHQPQCDVAQPSVSAANGANSSSICALRSLALAFRSQRTMPRIRASRWSFRFQDFSRRTPSKPSASSSFFSCSSVRMVGYQRSKPRSSVPWMIAFAMMRALCSSLLRSAQWSKEVMFVMFMMCSLLRCSYYSRKEAFVN
jgi:hypothetical protein